MGQSTVARRQRVDAERVIGWKVQNPDGENLGTVQNVVIDPATREVTRVVIAFGGFLGLGTKRYAVPWRALSARPDERILLLPADKSTIKEQSAAWDAHDEPAPEGVSLFLPSGRESSSALRVDLELPDELLSGETFSEEIRVTNLSSQTLDRVVVRQEIDAHFKMEPSRGAAVQSGELVWNVGTLDPDETRTLRVSGRVEGAESLRACCRASYELSACAVRPVVAPKLELDVDAPRECLVCDEIPVEIRARNAGNATLRDVELDAALPDGLEPLDGEAMKIDVLRPGETKSARLRLKPARRGEYTLQASARGGRADARATARVAVREPVLTILPGRSSELLAGSEGRAEFLVKNVGDGPSRDTGVEATASGSARLRESGSWALGTLAPGESRTIAATLDTTRTGTAEIALEAKGHCARAVSVRARLEVKGVPAVLLECVDAPDPVKVGGTAVYTIVALNQGSAPLTNLRLRCELEDSMLLESSDGATRGRGSRGALDFEPLPGLRPKEKAQWRVAVKALKPADARFKVSLTCDQIPRAVEETESTHFF